MNILIVAHEFSPYLGSECAVGWNLVKELANNNRITVIIAETNQFKTNNYYNDYKNYISKNHLTNNLTVIPVPQTKFGNIISFFNRLISNKKTTIGHSTLYFITYNLWQRSVFKFVKENINLNEIDIIHQLTSISFREPGYLWKINKPFVWGPISGNVRIPLGFYSLLDYKQKFIQIIRSAFIFLQLNFSKRIIAASKKTSVLFCVTKEDYNHFKNFNLNNVIQMLDVGCEAQSSSKNFLNINEEIKFLWIGRIVPSKALELLLYSIKNIQDNNENINYSFTIIGDGPDLKKNKILANKLDLKNINWLGHLPHKEVLDILSKGSCLIHTSIREATSATILEALSFSVPVICHDAFGMSIAINDNCGIKIPFLNTKASINGFTNAIQLLIDNKNLLNKFSQNALIRSKHLSWEEMARQINQNYIDVFKK